MGNTQNRRNRDAVRQAMEASMAEAPLPFGWEESFTDKGVVYYIDHARQKTTFQDPRRKGRNAGGKNKPKGKPPKYEPTLYSKCQSIIARTHKISDEGQLDIVVSRDNLFEDSYKLISELDAVTLTRRLFLKFEGEDGLDYGGMSREWFLSLSEEMFSPKRHLFMKSKSGYFYQINRHSADNPNHLQHFRFVGMIMGMAIYHCKMLHSQFNLTFYKQLLGRTLEKDDLKLIDEKIFDSVRKIEEADTVEGWDLDFTISDQNAEGKTVVIELQKGGADIEVTNSNKQDYVKAILRYYLNSTTEQMEAIRDGFMQLIPADLMRELEPEELEVILCGTQDIDIKDLQEHTDYGEGFAVNSPVVKLFWEVLGQCSPEELKRFLQFTTGSNKVPLGGFAHLYGSNGPQKFQISPKKTPGLPTAHACFNRLELSNYSDADQLRKELLLAVSETQGFGLE